MLRKFLYNYLTGKAYKSFLKTSLNKFLLKVLFDVKMYLGKWLQAVTCHVG